MTPSLNNILRLIVILSLVVSFSGCQKDEITYTDSEFYPGAFKDMEGTVTTLQINDFEITCEKFGEEFVYQGDIVIHPNQIDNSSELKGVALLFNSSFWPNNTVYYTIDSDLPNKDRVESAIDTYHGSTNVQFVQREASDTHIDNYITFIRSKNSTSSNPGMVGGEQFIKLQDEARSVHVIHEIGHSIGLLHEQSRIDRDDYVVIHWDNIKQNKKHNFEMAESGRQSKTFDYRSVMIYSSKMFSKNGENTMTARFGDPTIDEPKTLSAADEEFINSIYQEDTEFLLDIEGNTYKTIQIGDQLWMAENLRSTMYADGTAIPEVANSSLWNALSPTDEAYCWYNNSSTNESLYGGLYTWAAATNGITSSTNPSNVQGVCPDGWHLPSDEEWKQMELFIGMDNSEVNEDGWRGVGSGGLLKETGTSLWDSPNVDATNSYGFSAIPGGYRNEGGPFGFEGVRAEFWTSTENGESDAWIRILRNLESDVARVYGGKTYGYSVRCIRDF